MPKKSTRRSSSFPRLPIDSISLPVDADLLPLLSLLDSLEDPRRDHLKAYSLSHVLALSVIGMLAECENWVEIADFARLRQEWFASHGLFVDGTPSHDTLGRIFRLLDAGVFARCFALWIQQAVGQVSGVVAIDGKTSRASGDGDLAKAIHTVSAWSSETGVTLAQVATAEKSNEITAIPQVLDLIAVHGCTVTIDAMGCQKDIAEKIRHGGGDYLLQVKNNQPSTLSDLVNFFTDADQRGWKAIEHTTFSTSDKKNRHGRHEVRTAWACPVSGPWIDSHKWTDLCQVVRINRQRTVGKKTTNEDHYYITSDHRDAAHQLSCARQHWGIENRCHWVLDVAFNEDRSRVRKNHAAHNLVTIRRFVLNLLRLETSDKGIKRRRKIAGWDLNYLIQLLARIAAPVSLGE
jgi:predicted transposase YbfD/YdcC